MQQNTTNNPKTTTQADINDKYRNNYCNNCKYKDHQDDNNNGGFLASTNNNFQPRRSNIWRQIFFDICVEYDNQTTYTNDIPYSCKGKWSLHKGKIYSKEIMIRKTIIYWKQTLVREITHTITREHDGTVVKLILQTQYYKRWKCNIHTFSSSLKKKVECNLKRQSQKRLYCDDEMWRRNSADLMLLRRRSIDRSMGMHYVVIT